MKKNPAIYLIINLSLIFSLSQSVSSQNLAFDSLANEINKLSLYKKTEALEMLNNLYQMAYNSPDSSLLIAHCLYEESLLNFRQGIIDTTLTDRIRNRLAEEKLLRLEHALLQSAMGTNQVMLGEYSDAFTLHLQALEKFKSLELNRFIARTLNSLSNICNTIGLLYLADYYLSEAVLYIYPAHHEYYIIKQNTFNIELFGNMNEAAIDSTLLLLEFAKRDGHEEIIPSILINLSGYLLDPYPDRAYKYLSELETLDFDNPTIMGVFSFNMGYYFHHKNDFSNAMRYFREAKTILDENNDFNNLSKLYGNISTLFEQQHNPDSALFYARQQVALVEKLHSNTIAVETHQKYITTLVEAQKNELIIADQQIKLKNRRFVIVLIISISVILIISLFLLYVDQQKRRKTSENRKLHAEIKLKQSQKNFEKKMLDAKIRELTSYSVLVSNKNNILKQIGEQIEQTSDKKENINTTLREIKKLIHNNLNIDEEWKNFKLHFDSVHPQFFEKLKEKSADLTEENMRVCAYIKMGLSSKDIAQLLNVVPRSVITCRYRIRKKLDLGNKDENLDVFLRNLQ